MLDELARDLDEIGGLQRIARLVVRMIAPDAQQHAIAGVGQRKFAVRLALPGGPGFCRIHLHVDACGDGAVLRTSSNFADGQQVEHAANLACSLRDVQHQISRVATPHGFEPRITPPKGSSL